MPRHTEVEPQRGGCRDSLDKEIVVSIPFIPFDLNLADSSLCNGDSLRLLLSSPLPGLSFSWTVNAVNVNGAASGSGNEIRQQLSLADAGLGDGFADYTITPVNGSCLGAPGAKRIFVNAFPEAPLVSVISGSSPICPGDSLVLSSSALSDNQWFRNAAAISAPAGTAQVLAARDSGNYSVSFTSPEGCSSKSASIRLDVRELPEQPTISGPAGFCSGDSIILRSSTASGNQWQLNGIDISGAVDSILTLNQPGSYSIRLNNSICPVLSSAFVVVEFQNPPVPVISGPSVFCSGSFVNLSSSAAAGNQWFLNASALNADTLANIQTGLAGTYTVSVSDSNGCSSLSADFVLNSQTAPLPSTISGPASACNGGCCEMHAVTST
jgi:hypothetical protein